MRVLHKIRGPRGSRQRGDGQNVHCSQRSTCRRGSSFGAGCGWSGACAGQVLPYRHRRHLLPDRRYHRERDFRGQGQCQRGRHQWLGRECEWIAGGSSESGFSQTDVATWAYTGTGIREGRPKIEELRAICNLYPETVHVVVRKGLGAKSSADLKGKRISIDEPGSGSLVIAPSLTLKIAGVVIAAPILLRQFAAHRNAGHPAVS